MIKQGFMGYRASKSPKIILAGAPKPLQHMRAPSGAPSPCIANNDNMPVKAEWMTPAEALQAICRIKRRLTAENIKNFALFHSAARRKIWDEVNACEQCLRWMYFRERP